MGKFDYLQNLKIQKKRKPRNPLTGINSYLYTLDEMCCSETIETDHNGSIALDTSEWGGAEFRIELPIERRMYPR